MFEKCNPSHPDKVADRIAGAMLDLSYKKQVSPKVAIEVLIGHKHCHIINETSCHLTKKEIKEIVYRITEQRLKVNYLEVPQDYRLAKNQDNGIKCGDNGIFKGTLTTKEQAKLIKITKDIYKRYPFDGKYIISDKELIICQSNTKESDLKAMYPKAVVNPLGFWTGGTDVDTGCTNRKLGSDMGDAVTGGGLMGKDLSKADVSVNIFAHLKAQEYKKTIQCYCAIGDKFVKVQIGNSVPVNVLFAAIVDEANKYIKKIGGFEKFAEYGLIR